jgi:hypothetical protein
VKMEKRGLEAEGMDPRKPKWDLLGSQALVVPTEAFPHTPPSSIFALLLPAIPETGGPVHECQASQTRRRLLNSSRIGAFFDGVGRMLPPLRRLSDSVKHR